MTRESYYPYARGDRFEGKAVGDVFEVIFRERVWENKESVSGPGSSCSQTGEILRQLPGLIRRFEIASLLDLPCGDFHWMQRADLGACHYTGADIVPDLIAANQHAFGGPFRSFICHDLISDPPSAYDLVFCRDGLVHFSFAHIWAALRNLRASGSRYLLTTTFTDQRENADIITGGWRPLNLCAAPFLFPPPLYLLVEKCTEGDGLFRDKSLALWRLSDLPLPDSL